MAGQPFYTVKQASEIVELPEVQVEGYIQQKSLAATFNHNIMSYVITHDDLIAFMKDRKLWKQLQKVMSSRVLLCDRDQKLVFILKNELERGGKVMVKIATSSKDAELVMSQWLPDVLVMHMAALQRQSDSLISVLRQARESRPVKLILYHNQPDAVIQQNEDTQKMLEYLNVDATVSIAAGTRGLLTHMMEMLGLRTTMRIIRPLGSSTPPAQPRQEPPTGPGNPMG